MDRGASNVELAEEVLSVAGIESKEVISHRVELKSNQTLVGYTHKICASIALVSCQKLRLFRDFLGHTFANNLFGFYGGTISFIK